MTFVLIKLLIFDKKKTGKSNITRIRYLKNNDAEYDNQQSYTIFLKVFNF